MLMNKCIRYNILHGRSQYAPFSEVYTHTLGVLAGRPCMWFGAVVGTLECYYQY